MTLRGRREVAAFRTQRVFEALRRAVARAHRPDFRIVHYSVQWDHVHLIVEAGDRERLRAGVQGMAIRMARAVNRALTRRRGSVWADRYHRHDLRTPREVRNALVYVLMNHRKHGVAGTARRPLATTDAAASVANGHEPTLDACSSAQWFDGWSARAGPLIVSLRIMTSDTSGDRCPVAQARTWLARIGWRRHGELEPDERPSSPTAPR